MRFPTVRNPFKQSDAAGADPVAAYAAAGHLLATPDGVWAYYTLRGVDFLGRSADEQRTIQRAQAHRWSELAGHRVYLRQTATPWPHQVWADKLARRYPHPGEPRTDSTAAHRLRDQPGGTPFRDLLGNVQAVAAGFGARQSVTVLGVRLDDRRVKSLDDLKLVAGDDPVVHKQLEATRRARTRIDKVVAKEGWGGVPASTNFVAWLIHASMGMGAEVPAALTNYPGRTCWDDSAVPGFTDPVRGTGVFCGLTARLDIARDSRKIVKHVAALVVEDFGPRPESLLPFLAWTLDYDPTPLEVVGVFDVVDGRDLKRDAEKVRNVASEVEKHNLEHDVDPPAEALRAYADARELEDQCENGDAATRTRLIGSWWVAVTGDSEDEALDAARALREAAAEEQSVVLVHNYDQYRKWRTFTPGEPPPDTGGHVRWVPGRYAAAGLTPNVSVSAGDPTGFMVGPVYGGHDLGLLDPFGGSLRNMSGVCLTCGNQGCGKSALAGALCYWTARLGVRTVAVDPAGLWKSLTELPDLKADARFINVASTSINPGALAPTVMIPDPRRHDYRDETAWREAVSTAKSERIELLVDTFYGLLPYNYRESKSDLLPVLMTACAEVGGEYGTDTWAYVAELDSGKYGDLGRDVARYLRATTEMKQGALVFPARGRDVNPEDARRLLDSATLTVISTDGLQVPPAGVSQKLWTPQQQATVPVLALVARLATLAMYSDRHSPTNVTIDELRLIAAAGTGFPGFVNRVTVDSRKWFAFVNLLFQAPSIINEIDKNIGNLAGMAFVGRLDTNDAQEARVLLRDDDPGSGIEDTISSQTSGYFHWRDWEGRRREVNVDQSWWPQDLLAALDTTPGGFGAYDDQMGSQFGVPS